MKKVLPQAGLWTVLLLPWQLAWEIAQLPLYTLWNTGTSFDIAYAVTHCTIGDGLIGATCYLLTSLILRDPNWPLRSPTAGGVLIVALGLLYTAASEWYHVHVAASWGYAQSMPTVLGVGASPLLQWLLVPPITLACYRLVMSGRQR